MPNLMIMIGEVNKNFRHYSFESETL